jgi:hypothetical protein
MRRNSIVSAAVASAACVVLAAGLMPTAASGAQGATAGGRQSRASNLAIAGGDIYLWSIHRSARAGDGCTLSFAVRSKRTHRLGSLTAGHCVKTLAGGPAYTVHQTRGGKRNTTFPGHKLGEVHVGAYRVGAHGDSALIVLLGHRRAPASVFTGGPTSDTSISVAGLAHLADGIKVCYSGAASGEHCGFTVVGRPRTVAFRDGGRTIRIRHEWRATRATCTSRVGDSGAPVYVKRDGKAYAVGILSGGQERSSKCPFYFTSVTLALTQLHVRLLRAP